MIPGDEIALLEDDLLKLIGRELALKEHEQRKRLALIQAYAQLEAELEALKKPKLLGPDDVVLGNP